MKLEAGNVYYIVAQDMIVYIESVSPHQIGVFYYFENSTGSNVLFSYKEVETSLDTIRLGEL